MFSVLVPLEVEGEFCGGCTHACHDNDNCSDTCGLFAANLSSKCIRLDWRLLRCEECLAAEGIVNGDYQALTAERQCLVEDPTTMLHNGNWKKRNRLALLDRYLPQCTTAPKNKEN